MNGVDRGGSTHISWKAYQYRVGNRETNTRRTSGGGLGFRLSVNGVRRGGTGIVSVTMFQANRVRCGSRYTRQFSGDSSLIGFRLSDGVIRGGGYSSQDTANFRVDGIRISSYQLHRGMPHIGFR